MKILVRTIMAVALLSSCVKDPIYDTPYPNASSIDVTVDWSALHPGDVAPTPSQLYIGGEHYTISNPTQHYAPIPTQPTVELLLHNTPEGITISNGVATLNGTPYTVEPGALYYGTDEVALKLDYVSSSTLLAERGTAPLNLAFSFTASEASNMQSVVVTLTGIASVRDLRTDALSAPVELVYNLTAADLATSPLVLSYNLLGVVGSSQLLTIHLTTTDGVERTITSELAPQLTTFNDKMEELTLMSELELPVDAHTTGTITNWNVIDNGSFEIH